MNCNCDKNLQECKCENLNETAETVVKNGFDAWLEVLEEEEQPTCNIENQEDCENCGS
tara:strand:- start:1051 stop:1224 length:174 start_codon:yes stop_codon:yes gene_type:complete